MRPTASTRDNPKFTQIKVNSQSVFICVHLWLKRSFPISVNGYALACWRPTLVALDFARRSNRDSHAAKTLGMGIECSPGMNWHVNFVSNVARRGAMIPDRISAASERCTCHVARTVVTCERNYVSSGSDRAAKSPRDESQNHKSQRIANANKAFNQSGGGSGFEIDA